MYGLKQAAILAYNQLNEKLVSHIHSPVTVTGGLWEPTTRRNKICFCLEDFGLMYFSKKDADHLLDVIG